MEILYIVLAIIMLLIVFVITYNIWDNRRIKVTKITKKIKLKDVSYHFLLNVHILSLFVYI